VGEGATQWYAAVTVLGEIIREPAFDELRTKQALGYIASAGAREVVAPVELCAQHASDTTPTTVSVDALTPEGIAAMSEGGDGGSTTTTTLVTHKLTLPVGTCRVPSLYTLVQGITLPALGLEGRVEGFIDATFPAFLRTLTEEGLKAITESLARSLEEGEKDTGGAFAGVWGKVVSRTYDWRGWAREAAGLRALTVGDVVRVWGLISGEGRREFWGLIQGKVEGV
jgi:secreted Zn-dependent insulinase-like peptidase